MKVSDVQEPNRSGVIVGHYTLPFKTNLLGQVIRIADLRACRERNPDLYDNYDVLLLSDEEEAVYRLSGQAPKLLREDLLRLSARTRYRYQP